MRRDGGSNNRCGSRAKQGGWPLPAAVLAAFAMATPSPAGAEYVYVANAASDNVSVIDTRIDRVIGRPIPVGKRPVDVALTPDGTTAYVANVESDSVSVINTRTNRLAGPPVELGTSPSAVAISPDGKAVYVSHRPSGSHSPSGISVIGARTRRIVDSIVLLGPPTAIAITPDGRYIYVATGRSATIIDAETHEVAASIDVNNTLKAIAISPDGSRAYLSYFSLSNHVGTVGIVDTATNELIDSITGAFGSDIEVSPDGGTGYLAVGSFSDGVALLNLKKGELGPQIDVGSGADAIALTSDGSAAYVANRYSNDVSVIGTRVNQVVRQSVPVGSEPRGIAIGDSRPAYLEVGVRCPRRAWPYRCRFRMWIASRGRAGRRQSSVAAFTLRARESHIATLLPARAFRARHANPRRIFLAMTVAIGPARHTWVRPRTVIQ